MSRNVQPPKRQLGVTLLEMLVTLVIVAMIGAILAQALSQLSRIERQMSSGQLSTVTASLHAEWVRASLEALMPGGPDEVHFTGDDRQLSGLSTQVPHPQADGFSLLKLRLVTDEGRNETRLELMPPTELNGASLGPVEMLRWPGREGRFRYLSRQGEWLAQWPPLSSTTSLASGPAGAASAATLPLAVMLETQQDRPGTLVAAPRGSAPIAVSRRAIEGM